MDSTGGRPDRSAVAAGPLRSASGQYLAWLHLEGLGQLPHSAKGDGATGFDTLVVPEAETKVHHVFLCEGASFSQRPNAAPEE